MDAHSPDQIVNDYLHQKYGTKAFFYHSSNGDIFSKYFNDGDHSLEYYLYKQESNMFYYKNKSADTLYYYPADELYLDLDSLFTGGVMEVLNQHCESVCMNITYKEGRQAMTNTYYYSGYPWLDSELYKKNHDMFKSKLYAKSNSPILRFTSESSDLYLEHTAIDLKIREVDESLFQVPDLPLKKY